MAESYTSTQRDTRTFGLQQQRLLDDLNRPDLQSIVVQYLQDAMRYYARKSWFFNEIDNSGVPVWAPDTYQPQGACVLGNSGGTLYVFCALNTIAVQTGTVEPAWPSTVFTVPTANGGSQGAVFPPPPPPYTPDLGLVQDNLVIWANIGPFQNGIFTQLSTVYNINQYQPPIDYVMPRLVEVTWSQNLREGMRNISYEDLRAYDVIRPSPPYSYPYFWAWFQQQIYFWPYPNGFYPITLSYRTAPPLVVAASDSNFWTTKAERLVRKYAQGSIEREVLHDEEAAVVSFQSATEEQSSLRSQNIGQTAVGGIPSSGW